MLSKYLSESSKICSTKRCKSSKCRARSVTDDRKRVKSTKTKKRKKIARTEPVDESEDEEPVNDEEQTRSPADISPRKSDPPSPASSEYSNGF